MSGKSNTANAVELTSAVKEDNISYSGKASCSCWHVTRPYCRVLCFLTLIGIGISDCVNDWLLYYERDEQIENICQQAATEIRGSTKVALICTFVFVILGTILVAIESVNWLLDLCELPMMHPVFLSIVVSLLEEVPLAVLRWRLKTAAENKTADGKGIAGGILGIISPLVGPLYRCYEFSSCSCDCCDECWSRVKKECQCENSSCCSFDEEKTWCSEGRKKCQNCRIHCKKFCCCSSDKKTCCDGCCPEKWEKRCKGIGICSLVVLAIIVATFAGINWFDYKVPGAKLCV